MIASSFGKHSVSWPDTPQEYGYPERNGLSASNEVDIGIHTISQAHQEEDDAPWALNEQAQVRWSTPMPADRCAGYGTKVYTAELQGVSFFSDQRKACRSTPVIIQNVNIPAPVKCETKGVFQRRTIGHWVAPSNDTDCSPRWGKFVDKVCLLSLKLAHLLYSENACHRAAFEMVWPQGYVGHTPSIFDPITPS